jgi:hypothetical protein
MDTRGVSAALYITVYHRQLALNLARFSSDGSTLVPKYIGDVPLTFNVLVIIIAK